jgi:hypothetical protein
MRTVSRPDNDADSVLIERPEPNGNSSRAFYDGKTLLTRRGHRI